MNEATGVVLMTVSSGLKKSYSGFENAVTAPSRAEHYAREAAERDPAQRAEAVERKFLGHAKLAEAAQHRQR